MAHWLKNAGRRSLSISLTVGVALASFSCGKDETDFEDLDGEFGSVPGNFNVRLATVYRDRVDSIGSQMDTLVPGLTGSLVGRFDDDDDETFLTTSGETKLSDLLKVSLPGTESEFINQKIFSELTTFGGDDGNYFDVVDTEKFLQGPAKYDPGTKDDATYDPERTNQYYLDMIRWEEAVKDDSVDTLLASAAPVVVAVLDTGVLATHEDLEQVMWESSEGHVGYDAVTKSPINKSESDDVNGHGTHVAGIIAAEGKNAVGIHGVGYLPRPSGSAVGSKAVAEVMAVKVLNDNGAGTSDMIAGGLKWAVDQHVKQKTGVRANQKLIINMSLGGPFETSGYTFPEVDGQPVFEDDIINYAVSKGDVLVVVAAGNETCGIGGSCDLYGDTYQRTFYYPCSYKNVLCVAATTHEDKLAGFSNRKSSVGIAAPGYQIASTVPDETKKSYAYYSGTSQATPVTAGAASVVWGLYPDFTAEEIKAILQNSAATVADITGEITSGDGRLDLKAALDYAAFLKANNKSPLDTSPPDGTVKSEPTEAPAGSPTGGDPYAPSENQKSKSTDSKGKGSANGACAVGAGTMAGWPVFLFMLLPLTLWLRRE